MNNSWARKTAQTGVIAAGAVLVAGAGTAHATGNDITTSDQIGAVSGNQVVAPVQAPVNICGIAAAVLGHASAGCEGGAEATFNGPTGDLKTERNYGLGNGNQAFAPIQVPTEVSGIAGAVGGIAGAHSDGGSSATIAESGSNSNSDVKSQRNVGLLSGNQLLAPVQAPINACGNAVAVGGSAGAECEGGADADFGGPTGGLTSEDNVGLGNGNQLYAPIQAPINVCGNAIAILGSADASCEGGSDADIPDDDKKHDGHKKHHGHHKAGGYKESQTTEAANTATMEQLPTGGVPGLDVVSGAAETVTGNLPVGQLPLVGDLTDNTSPEGVVTTATGTVGSVTELAGAGLL